MAVQVPIIVFDGTHVVAEGIWQGWDINNIQSPSFAFIFTPTNNDWTPSNYQSTGPNDNYTYNPVYPPNLAGFIAAIQADNTITAADQLNLAIYAFPFITQAINNPTQLKAYWSALVTAFSGTWLSGALQTLVTGYATSNYFALV